METEAKIEGKTLIIKLDINEHPSKTGKTTVIATTSGNIQTNLMHNGKPVVIGVNAYVK